MMPSEPPPFSRSPLRFFLLVAVLSVPFAALGTLTDRQLYPGIPISAPGAAWAGWHIIAMVQAVQSALGIAWGCLDIVATRVLMVWIYDNTGRSVFRRRTISLILACVAAAVTVAWGPGLTARWRSV